MNIKNRIFKLAAVALTAASLAGYIAMELPEASAQSAGSPYSINNGPFGLLTPQIPGTNVISGTTTTAPNIVVSFPWDLTSGYQTNILNGTVVNMTKNHQLALQFISIGLNAAAASNVVWTGLTSMDGVNWTNVVTITETGPGAGTNIFSTNITFDSRCQYFQLTSVTNGAIIAAGSNLIQSIEYAVTPGY